MGQVIHIHPNGTFGEARKATFWESVAGWSILVGMVVAVASMGAVGALWVLPTSPTLPICQWFCLDSALDAERTAFGESGTTCLCRVEGPQTWEWDN